MCGSCIGDIFGIEAFYGSDLTRGGFLATSAAAAGLVAAGAPSRVFAAPGDPLTVFYGGPIITMDDGVGNGEAVAISGNTILAVGTKEDVLRAAGARARTVNL
jgi:hypothetical protein